jgi:hypothetical protein
MHIEALTFITRSVHRFHPRQARGISVLEFGSRDVNGGLRHLYPRAAWTGIDITEGPGVDIVADAADWRGEQTYDLVICAEVLEHTARWAGVLASAAAHMHTGSVLVTTCATDPRAPHGAHDPDGSIGLLAGEWYENVTPEDLYSALEGLSFASIELTVDRNRGDLYAVAT